MNTLEEWRDVAGYDGLYQISDLGRVRSFNGRYGRLGEPRIMVPQKTRSGYLMVLFSRGRAGIKARHHTIHQLVAKAFIPNPEGKSQVNHRDGDKANNAANNLEWNTQTENQRHAWAMGLIKRPPTGDGAYHRKLSTETARQVKIALREGFTQQAIADRFGICCKHVRNVRNGVSWGWVQI